MRRTALFTLLILLPAAGLAPAQDHTVPKRSVLGRILHPFSSSEKIPEYRNPKLRGLILSVELPSEPAKLSEMRQLPVTVRLTNRGDRAVELSFPTEQRIEILLRDAAGRVVTRWSDNRAFEANPATILVNPNEHLEYAETIATRDLVPGKVFTVEAVVPAYPELDAKRKSMAAP
ncbi:MAG TPA: BsuPI-related putative proteinase inhibitor [Chthoniobacterales bacterium]|jgi:hypothetical protein